MIKKLLAIIVLVMVASLSVAGCTTTNNTNQTTPSAAASSTGHDPLLAAIAANIQSGESAYNPTITWSNATPPGFHIDELWVDSNGVQRGIGGGITKYSSTAAATADFKNLTIVDNGNGGSENVFNDGHPTQYAQAEVAAALGHAPIINKDMSWHYEGEPQAQHEIIQYDNILIFLNQDLGITSSGPATP